MKEIRYNVNQSVWIADGERKCDYERREGAARTWKRCAFKDSVSCKPGLTTPRFKPNNSQKRSRVFLFDPPPKKKWFDVALQGTPPPTPLTDHVVCVHRPYGSLKKSELSEKYASVHITTLTKNILTKKYSSEPPINQHLTIIDPLQPRVQ